MPDFGAASAALKECEEVEIAGRALEKTKPLDLKKAKRVEIRFADASVGGLGALAKSKLPAVERLSVWLGGHAHCVLDEIYDAEERSYNSDDEDDDDEDFERYPATYPTSDLERMDSYSVEHEEVVPALAAFLAAVPKQVKHLGVQSAVLDAEICTAIVSSSILPKLERLDLSGGFMKEEGAAVLEKAKKKLAHLKELDLRRIKLPEKYAARLKGLTNALTDDKGKGEPEFFFRYVATME
jgi:hypothetical protein